MSQISVPPYSSHANQACPVLALILILIESFMLLGNYGGWIMNYDGCLCGIQENVPPQWKQWSHGQACHLGQSWRRLSPLQETRFVVFVYEARNVWQVVRSPNNPLAPDILIYVSWGPDYWWVVFCLTTSQSGPLVIQNLDPVRMKSSPSLSTFASNSWSW